jgi:hypothetical protein
MEEVDIEILELLSFSHWVVVPQTLVVAVAVAALEDLEAEALAAADLAVVGK